MKYCIGNGQLDQLSLSAMVGALNCMHDQQAILEVGGGTELNESTTRNKVLRILWRTYGKEAVEEWSTSIMASLQQAEVLRQGMHGESIQGETETWDKLDDGTLPCPECVANWILRDMRERQECGRSPYRWESTEQRFNELTTVMPEMPLQSPQSCEDLFDMWGKGKGIWLLQQALYQIQEIRRPIDGEEGGDGMNDVSTVVRRLTPL